MEGDKLQIKGLFGDIILKEWSPTKLIMLGILRLNDIKQRRLEGCYQKDGVVSIVLSGLGNLLYIKNNLWGPNNFECVGGPI